MSKKVYLDKVGREGIFRGIELCANAVASTLGPSGKTVIIQNGNEPPFTTKDGVTVAKSIDSDDVLENIGILFIRGTSVKQDNDGGDGTTSANIFCHRMIEQGFKDQEMGLNDYFIEDVITYKNGMEYALKTTIDFIGDNAKKISFDDIDDLIKIAALSANNDIELGELVARAVITAKEFGTVNVIESIKDKSSIEHFEGFVFDLGLADATFGFDAMTGNFVAEKSQVLLYKGKITDREEWIRIANYVLSSKKNLIIIAQDYSTEILGLANFANKNFAPGHKICLVRNHMRENEFNAIYEDLEVYTGATVITKWSDASHDLGLAKNIVIKPGYSIFGKNKENTFDYYIDILVEKMEKESNPAAKKDIGRRIARFTTGVINFYVGGNSDIETKEKLHRVQDAVNACNGAIEEGIIIGGGQLLVKLAVSHFNDPNKKISSQRVANINVDFSKGYDNFMYALSHVFNQIYENSAKKTTKEEILYKISSLKDLSFGYDFKNHKFGNLFDMGIIDPAKVVTNALINATSIAGTVLTTDCVIAENNNKNDE